MEETIKNIEVIAYKGMEIDMTCKGFQYELGKTYKTDKTKLCNCGFHACLNPLDVLNYYTQEEGSRYYKVKLSGEIAKCSTCETKVAATEITILEEIPSDKFLTNIEWWKNKNILDLLYFSDGFARIRNCKRKYNFIGKGGKLLSEQWFAWADDFHEGCAVVKNEDYVYNFIGKGGKLLSEQWFEWVYDFKDGFARIKNCERQYNLITEDGKLLSKQWFDWVGDFKDGFAEVQRTNGECCKINKTGKIIKNYNRIWESSLKIYNRIWKRFI